MAGHSHWARIKHKKAVVDHRRGRLWSKLARHIIMAARAGGGNPSDNLSLRYAIDKAKAANMPNDTIDRAIKRGTGELEGAAYQEIVYEGYGPGGVALLVEALTDNPHRTAPEVRKIFEVNGGNLGASNCVAWLFRKKGIITLNAADTTEDALMELALESGADDVIQDDDVFEIITEPAAFEKVRAALSDKGLKPQSAELSMIPSSTIPISGEPAQRVLRLIEALEEHDDVQNVYANFDMPAAEA